MPDAVEMPEAFANADLAKPIIQMERAACAICGHDLRLQGPVFFVLGGGDLASEGRAADAHPLCCFIHIDDDLSDADRASRIGDGGEGGPTADHSIDTRHQSAD